MTKENAVMQQKSLQRRKDGKFQKGVCPNPKGRGKGAAAKTTRFLQIMTQPMQERAIAVLRHVLRQAEEGDKESQRMVLTVLQPFLRREAESEAGPKAQRPMINIVVNSTEAPAIEAVPVEAVDVESE